jgi:addiction module HigA family antidote
MLESWIIISEVTMNMKRQPTTPGEILQEEFLTPMKMTQKEFADHIGCDVKVINRIVNGRTSVTAEMALKIGAALKTTPDFWLNAQKAVEIYQAAQHVGTLPRPLKVG